MGNNLPLMLLAFGFVACMRSEPIPFSTDQLNFKVTSIVNQRSTSNYSFDLYVGVDKSIGPTKNDAISWALSVSDEKTGKLFLEDSNKLVESFYHTYAFVSENNKLNGSDSNYPVQISFKFFEHGKEIRLDTLHTFLFVDSNQYLGTSYSKVTESYLEDRSPLFYYGNCQVHGNSFYYDYRIHDTTINRGGAHYPGYFVAVKISNPDSTYVLGNGTYVSLMRAFSDTGEVPWDRFYSGDKTFKGDPPLFEMWVIYGKKYQYVKSICK